MNKTKGFFMRNYRVLGIYAFVLLVSSSLCFGVRSTTNMYEANMSTVEAYDAKGREEFRSLSADIRSNLREGVYRDFTNEEAFKNSLSEISFD